MIFVKHSALNIAPLGTMLQDRLVEPPDDVAEDFLSVNENKFVLMEIVDAMALDRPFVAVFPENLAEGLEDLSLKDQKERIEQLDELAYLYKNSLVSAEIRVKQNGGYEECGAESLLRFTEE